MKIDFLKKKKVFAKKHERINIEIYWEFVFYLGFVFTLVSFGFGFYLFNKINKEEQQTFSIFSSQMQSIDSNRINSALFHFENKENKFNELMVSPAPIIDPSI